MPSPHNSVSILGRSRGRSAVAAAAYRHATQMRMSRSEKSRDYSAKQSELKHTEIALPEGAARWAEEMLGRDAFARIGRMVEEATRAAELLDRLDERRLARAFRGEMVPQDPTDEPASTFLACIQAARAATPKPKRTRRKTKV